MTIYTSMYVTALQLLNSLFGNSALQPTGLPIVRQAVASTDCQFFWGGMGFTDKVDLLSMFCAFFFFLGGGGKLLFWEGHGESPMVTPLQTGYMVSYIVLIPYKLVICCKFNISLH